MLVYNKLSYDKQQRNIIICIVCLTFGFLLYQNELVYCDCFTLDKFSRALGELFIKNLSFLSSHKKTELRDYGTTSTGLSCCACIYEYLSIYILMLYKCNLFCK